MRSPAWHTRARLKRAKARRLLRAHHGSHLPMSKTWECGKCGKNNPPHRQKCQTWNCRERGPGQEDGGYWDCGCGCESNFASRSKCRSCGVVRGRCQQQQGQSGRKLQFTQGTFAAVVAEEAGKPHAQLGHGAIDVPMMETGQDVAPSYSVGEPGCIHCSSDAGRCGRRGRVPSRRSASGSRLSSRPSDRSRPGSERPTRLTRKQTRSTRRWSRRKGSSWLCSWPSRG